MTEELQCLDTLNLGRRQVSVLSDVSAEEYVNELLKRTTRSESVNIIEGNSDASSSMMPNFHFIEGIRNRMNRSGSMYVPPKVSQTVLERSEKLMKPDSSIYLKDRGILRYMIH